MFSDWVGGHRSRLAITRVQYKVIYIYIHIVLYSIIGAQLPKDPSLQTGYTFVPEMTSDERRSALKLCGPSVSAFMAAGQEKE